MALPPRIREAVEQRLTVYCLEKVPAHVRDKVRISYRFRGDTVTLFEERPHRLKPGEWTSLPFSQFRYSKDASLWTLYWPDRNGRWHRYPNFPGDREFEAALQAVDTDRSGAFWG